MHRSRYRLSYPFVLLLFVLAACVQEPLIQAFTASDTAVTAGTEVKLSWIASNFDTLTLTPSVDDVIGETSVTVRPSETTTYTLTASKGGSRESRELTVIVGEAPTVESFAFQPASAPVGGDATLSWNVANADSVTIDQGVGQQGAQGSATVSKPARGNYTYTLRAENEFGSTTETATLAVGAGPTIVSFSATPSKLPEEGGTVTLSWEIGEREGPLELSIDNGVGEVTGRSSVRVSLEESATFTLSATDDEGTSTASVTVAVGERPAITDFAASDTTVTAGAPVVLNWQVANTPVTLTLNGEPVSGNSTTVQPETTTTYTLRAVNEDGEDSESLEITVGAAPVITSFDASDDTVTAGTEVTLSWAASNFDTLTLTPSVGDVTGETSVSVAPQASTTYTLSASNDFGETSATTTVNVGTPPVVSFTVSPSTPIEEGDSAILNWTVTGEDVSVTIDNGIGSVPASGSESVSPTTTTDYTLTATSPFGTVTRQVTVVVSSGDRITFLIAGQSNAVGQGEITADCGNCESPISQVRMLGNDYIWKTATEPVDSNVNQIDTVSRDDSPGHSFGVKLGKELYNVTGSDVYLIPAAKGGSCLQSPCNEPLWEPLGATDRSTLFGSAVYRARVSAGTANNPPNGVDDEGGPATGVIWYQGESDAYDGDRENNFIVNTNEVMDEFRQNLGAIPTIYVQLALRRQDPTRNIDYQDIRERQRLMETGYGSQARPDFYMVVAHDLPMIDANHLNAEGQKILGERLALAYQEHVLEIPGVDGTGPRLVSIVREDDTHIKVTTTRTLTEDVDDDDYANYFLVYNNRVAITSGVSVERHPSDDRAVQITIPAGLTGSLSISYAPPTSRALNTQVTNVVKDAASGLPMPSFGDGEAGTDGQVGLPVPYTAETP